MRAVYTEEDREEEREEMRVVLVSDEAVSCSEGFHKEEVKMGGEEDKERVKTGGGKELW